MLQAGALAVLLGPAAATAVEPAETVVLVPGFLRTARSMGALAEALEDSGYRPLHLDYASTREPIPHLAARMAGELDRCCAAGGPPVHFVTHSMGGILVRFLLAGEPRWPVGRVVMLSPPNQGSEIVEMVAGGPLAALLGPAARQLGTRPEDFPRRLGPVDFELGVVAGNRSLNPLFSWLIPGPDDGQVSLAAARIEGMRDFVVVPATHPFIMRNRRAIAQTLHFLATGAFDHPER